jgi:hypothetical protein
MNHWKPTEAELQALESPQKSTKLTVEQVLDARIRARDGVPIRQLAREYGVGPDAVSAAVKGKTWRSLPFPPDG